ncbi:hypothetical protein DB88DRAFT_509422 [Papiliotrema laurentii]|uniref:Uncharacterized protein n=1 Tax=Papiliotrema laurentii TaxID=5418 RepID=A0AAD9FTG8_PAPLA|nr:hypothetical protein DB88DRAFT_509422 [Papiliotrema laurentii]
MPPTILSSPLLTLPAIDTMLANPALTPLDRIPLLHAKIALLTNDLVPPSSAASATIRPPPAGSSSTSGSLAHAAMAGPSSGRGRQEISALIDEMQTRIQVASLLMDVRPARLVEAESELTMVEGRCKGVIKADKDRRKKVEMGQGDGEGSSDHSTTLGVDASDLDTLKTLRVDGLKMLARVEESLGREGRAKRWRELAEQLTS